jgi:hypothetical protein
MLQKKKGTPRSRVPFLIVLIFQLDLLFTPLPSSAVPGSLRGKIPGGLASAGKEPWFPSRIARSRKIASIDFIGPDMETEGVAGMTLSILLYNFYNK